MSRHATSSSVITSFGKLYAFGLDLIIHTKEKYVVLFGRIGCQLLLTSILLVTWMKTVEFVQS